MNLKWIAPNMRTMSAFAARRSHVHAEPLENSSSVATTTVIMAMTRSTSAEVLPMTGVYIAPEKRPVVSVRPVGPFAASQFANASTEASRIRRRGRRRHRKSC